MFERFTAQARTVVHDARRESRDLGHYWIGTEHLLLALLAPHSGIPAGVLGDAGLTAERVRADVSSNLSDDRLLDRQDAEALESIGIDLEAVRAKIEENFGPGALCPAPRTRRGLFRRRSTARPSYGRFTARSKKVLELSLREALRLHHNYIGSEHILLGLIREGEGLAAKIICDAGISLDELRRRTLDSLAQAA
jgi:ATP-dependent Clp protease ATP-binding subunit ClpA